MKQEAIYLGIGVILCCILLQFPFDVNTLMLHETLYINAHDTYFVVDMKYHAISSLIFSFAFVYFLRILFTKFQNRLVNYLYLIFNGLFIVLAVITIISSVQINILSTLTKSYEEQGIYDPNNFGFSFHLFIILVFIAFVLEIYAFWRLRERR